MKKYLLSGSLIALSFALLFSSVTSAEAFGKKKVRAHGEASIEATNENSCLRAFGHLIAPGWIKKHGSVSLSDACALPPGIAKLIDRTQDDDDTDPTDTTAPVISDITVETGTTTAVISWTTDEQADSAVFYATSTPVDIEDPHIQMETNTTLSSDHEIMLTDLDSETLYYFVIRSKDAAGNAIISTEISFTTLVESDVTPPLITDLVAIVGTSTIQVTWMTDEPATSAVFYATSTPVDVHATSTASVEDATLSLSHDLIIEDLAADTDYHLVVESADESGNVTHLGEYLISTAF